MKIICRVLIVCLLAGCTSQKQISYLQNLPENYSKEITKEHEIRFKPDDLISIMVNSKDPELAQMFNLPMVSYQISSSANGYAGAQNRVLGYQVDKTGHIDFPQLGEIKVAGMTRSTLTTYVKEQLKSKGLLNDPVVTVQMLNFRVSVLGEVARPGTFNVITDQITLFEALANAGDLTIYGKRDNVKIVREEDGKQTVATVDLRSNEVLNSPYYYLKPGDVVYIEPNKARAGQREINQNRNIGVFASIISVLVSVSVLIFK